MSDFGPSRKELWFRVFVGVGGIGLLGVALWVRGVPSGPALVEVIGFGGAFFAGTVGLSAYRLWKTRAK
jgi:hypothetical protein